MAELLRLPSVAAGTDAATLISWLVDSGDSFGEGTVLAEIETDKATVELTAEADGVMGEHIVVEGEEVEVGSPVCVLLGPGEESVDPADLLDEPVPSPVDQVEASQQQSLPDLPSVPSAPKSGPTPETSAGRVFASPVARRLAAARGLELSRLAGSGPRGRVIKRDVLEALGTQPERERDLGVGQLAAPDARQVPHTRTRRAIAKRLAESKATVPHFYLEAELRVDRLLKLREEINDGAAAKISVNDLLVKAAGVSLIKVPELNVSWTEEHMVEHQHADVAVAVAAPAGLITPIVRAAETKSVSVIGVQMRELAQRARDGSLSPSEFQGGSFTISNLGMFGVKSFSAIINPPHAGILAVGAARHAAVVEGEELTVGTVLACTLSVDHRAVDGVAAAKWLQSFQRLVENPLRILI